MNGTTEVAANSQAFSIPPAILIHAMAASSLSCSTRHGLVLWLELEVPVSPTVPDPPPHRYPKPAPSIAQQLPQLPSFLLPDQLVPWPQSHSANWPLFQEGSAKGMDYKMSYFSPHPATPRPQAREIQAAQPEYIHVYVPSRHGQERWGRVQGCCRMVLSWPKAGDVTPISTPHSPLLEESMSGPGSLHIPTWGCPQPRDSLQVLPSCTCFVLPRCPPPAKGLQLCLTYMPPMV